MTTASSTTATRTASGTVARPAPQVATPPESAEPADQVLAGTNESPGLRTFLAKSASYWTQPEGADEGYAVLPEPVRPAPEPHLHANPTGTLTIIEPPVSEGLKSFLAKPPDFFTNTDYV